jgi:hypothetical protein
VIFVATKKDMTTNFFHPSLLLLFVWIRDPTSGMNKNQDPGTGINIPETATLHKIYYWLAPVVWSLWLGTGRVFSVLPLLPPDRAAAQHFPPLFTPSNPLHAPHQLAFFLPTIFIELHIFDDFSQAMLWFVSGSAIRKVRQILKSAPSATPSCSLPPSSSSLQYL